jgi:hypothetical protein
LSRAKFLVEVQILDRVATQEFFQFVFIELRVKPARRDTSYINNAVNMMSPQKLQEVG